MKKFIKPILFGILFIIFTILTITVDVQPLGAQNTSIGFASLNTAVFELLGTNSFCYKLTQLLGLFAIAVAACFAVLGCIQLIKRKSLLKVDRNLLALGGVYILLILIYFLFEKLAINYRPVVLDEGLEASYPSTHTMLILTILGTAVKLLGDYIQNPKLLLTARIILLVFMALTVICRLLSGVHWLTDITGGILVSLFLITLYKSLICTTNESAKEN